MLICLSRRYLLSETVEVDCKVIIRMATARRSTGDVLELAGFDVDRSARSHRRPISRSASLSIHASPRGPSL